MILWLCYVAEWALPSSNRDTFSMHPTKLLFFHVWSWIPSSHPSALVAWGLHAELSHSNAIASLLIHWMPCPLSKIQLFPFLWLEWALLVCCTSLVSLGSAILLVGVRWEKVTELKLIKFKNTQQIDSWIRGKFSHAVTLYPVLLEDKIFVTFLIPSYQLVE